MSLVTTTADTPAIILSDMLSPSVRNIVELSKPYNTLVLLYEDDFSDNILAAWAEGDRLNLNTRKIGEIFDNIEIHTFGLDTFSPGTVLEISLRESSQDLAKQNAQRCAYKSLLNELTLLSVKVYGNSDASMLLQ